MSNAMRMGKRTLAGVAAGALAASSLISLGAMSAQAATVKPKAGVVPVEDAFTTGEAVSAPFGYAFTDVLSDTFKDATNLGASTAGGGANTAANTWPQNNAPAPVLMSVSTTSGVVFATGYSINGATGKTSGQAGFVDTTSSVAISASASSTPAVVSLVKSASSGVFASADAITSVNLSAGAAAVASYTVWADSDRSGTLNNNEVYSTNTVTFVDRTTASVKVTALPAAILSGGTSSIVADLEASGLPFWNPSVANTGSLTATDGAIVNVQLQGTSAWGSPGFTSFSSYSSSTYGAAQTISQTTPGTASAGATRGSQWAATTPALSTNSTYRAFLTWYAPGGNIETTPTAGTTVTIGSAATVNSVALSTSASGLVGATTSLAVATPNANPSASTGFIPRSTRTISFTATAQDAALAPVANVPVTFAVTNASGMSITLNGGSASVATSQSATLSTNASGVATLTVVVTSATTPASQALVVAVTPRPSTGGTIESTVTYSAAGAVNTAVSTATVAGIEGNKAATTVATSSVVNGGANAAAGATPARFLTLPITSGGPTQVPVAVTAKDIFGNPVPNATLYVWTAAPAGSPGTALTADVASASYTLTTNASGVGSVSIPVNPTNGQISQFAISNAALAATGANSVIGYWVVTYSTAANVTPSAITSTVGTNNSSAYASTSPTVAAGNRNAVTFNVLNAAGTSVGDNVPVTITAPANTLIAASAADTVATYRSSLNLFTTAGAVTVNIISTKSGSATLTATAGTATGTRAVSFVAGAAANVAVAPTAGGSVPASVAADSVTSMTASVTDANSNPVTNQVVQVSITGDATFAANGSKTLTGITSTAGTLAFDVRAGASGSFTVTATATSTVTVTTPSIAIGAAAKSIAITAYRSDGIVVVDGDAVGFERGDTVNIRVKYYNANKKKYTSWKGAGTALVKSGGSFSGFISTNKQVKVKVNGGGVVSNIQTVK